jgi:hypothetical protein
VNHDDISGATKSRLTGLQALAAATRSGKLKWSRRDDGPGGCDVYVGAAAGEEMAAVEHHILLGSDAATHAGELFKVRCFGSGARSFAPGTDGWFIIRSFLAQDFPEFDDSREFDNSAVARLLANRTSD